MSKFLASRQMFYAIVILFALESLAIALTARYPMAFDENFHYGVAQLHTHTLLPFLQNVPDSASSYGAISRDPSFLYHYLLSFPLRIINLLTNNVTWRILVLRSLNIALAVVALFVYRHLLRRIGATPIMSNIILLFFVLIPVYPLMAGQVTYDNLFFPLVASVLLLAVNFTQEFYTNKTVNVKLLNGLLLAGLFTCFVKYAFIPALLAIVVYLAVILAREPRKLGLAYKTWWQQAGRRNKLLTLTALVIGMWFFANSYGFNIVRYHTLQPDCDDVLSVEACMDYGPWQRDHIAKMAGGHASLEQLPQYTGRWTRQMMTETFFMVGAKRGDNGVVTYYSAQPLTTLFVTAWALLVSGVALLIWRFRQIWAQPVFRLLILTIGAYSFVLFVLNLSFFLETGDAVAIHGRYLLPFIPPLVAIIVIAARQAPWPRFVTRRLVTIIGIITFLSFLQGGLVSYIVLTNTSWMWPQSKLAQSATNAVKSVLTPLIYQR